MWYRPSLWYRLSIACLLHNTPVHLGVLEAICVRWHGLLEGIKSWRTRCNIYGTRRLHGIYRVSLLSCNTLCLGVLNAICVRCLLEVNAFAGAPTGASARVCAARIVCICVCSVLCMCTCVRVCMCATPCVLQSICARCSCSVCGVAARVA